MGTIDGWGWIDAPVDEVAEVATDARRLGAWFAFVRGTQAGDRLAAPGDVAIVEWRGGQGPTTLRVDRRVRDVLHLEAEGEGRVCMSLSAWNGGTAVELAVEADRGGIRPLTSWQLSRSIRRLGELVGVSETAVSTSGRRSDLVPRADAAQAART